MKSALYGDDGLASNKFCSSLRSKDQTNFLDQFFIINLQSKKYEKKFLVTIMAMPNQLTYKFR